MRFNQTSIFLFISLIALNSVSFMATNLYVPAMPSMSIALGVKDSWVQSSLTVYLIPFALLPVFLGPVTDRVERRGMILMALFITLFGNLLILWAGPIGLLAGRFLQGGAFGLITVSARALIADCFKGRKQAQYHSLVQCFSPIVSISSPLLGGIIQSYFGWEGIFIFLFVYTCLLWVLTRFSLPSPLKKTKKAEKFSFACYLGFIKNRGFMLYACLPACMMLGQSGFTSMSAYILQNQFNVPAKFYGLYTLPIYLSLIFSALINIRLLSRLKVHTLMVLGSSAIMMAGVLLVLMSVMSKPSVSVFVVSCMLFYLSNNLLVTNAYTKACEYTQGQQGTAFAFMSLLKMSAAVVSTILATWLPANTSTLMLFFLVAGVTSMTIVFLSKSGTKVFADDIVFS